MVKPGSGVSSLSTYTESRDPKTAGGRQCVGSARVSDGNQDLPVLKHKLRVHRYSGLRVLSIAARQYHKPSSGIVDIVFRDGRVGEVDVLGLDEVEPTIFDILAFARYNQEKTYEA